MSNQYVIQKETLDSIAAQSMSLVGKTDAVSTSDIITDLTSINTEVGTQAYLITQINEALEGKYDGDIPSGGIDTSDATATAEDIADGMTAYVNGELIEGNVQTISGQTAALADSFRLTDYHSEEDRIEFYKKHTTSSLYRPNSSMLIGVKVSEFGDAKPEDVLLGKTFTSESGLKIEGTHKCSSNDSEPALQSKIVIPTKEQQEIIADEGYDGLEKITVEGDDELVAGNIKKGVNIFGVDGSLADVSVVNLNNDNVTIDVGEYSVTINFSQAVSQVLGYSIFFKHATGRRHSMCGKINNERRCCYWVTCDWDDANNTSIYDYGEEELSDDLMSLTVDDGGSVTDLFTNNTCTITGSCVVKYK